MATAIGKSMERDDREFSDFWWRTSEGAQHDPDKPLGGGVLSDD
jgi:hypothetical protein